MIGILAEKRQVFEDLLSEMENLRDAVGEGRFDDLDKITLKQSQLIEKVEAIDRQLEQSGVPGKGCGDLAEELKGLVGRIAEINNGLIAEATKRSRDIQLELSSLHRGADATAGYRKQAGAKI